jgi:hypothetical protein
MSDLVYQNYNNRCQGWVNPSNLSFGPEIISLSSYQSPAGSSTVVSIYGTGFVSYSTIRFGTFTPTVYFVNSTILQFYVPNSLNSGTFTVQVCNGSVCSNTVNYTIDNASGYWLLNGANITNSNGNSSGGVVVSWLSRGILSQPLLPVDGTSLNPFPIPNNINWITCDVTTDNIFLNLPEGTEFTGREIMIKRIGNNDVLTIVGIVKSFDNQEGNFIVMSNTDPSYNYSWVTLVFDGSNWLTMQAG